MKIAILISSIVVTCALLISCENKPKTYEFSGLWIDSQLADASGDLNEMCRLKKSTKIKIEEKELLFINEDGEVYETSIEDHEYSGRQVKLNQEKLGAPSWHVTVNGVVTDSTEAVRSAALECNECEKITDHTMRTKDNLLLSTWRLRKKDGGIYSRQRKYQKVEDSSSKVDLTTLQLLKWGC